MSDHRQSASDVKRRRAAARPLGGGLVGLVAVGAAALLVGCASPKLAAPESPEEPVPDSVERDDGTVNRVDDAARELERAEREVWAALDSAAATPPPAGAGEAQPGTEEAAPVTPLRTTQAGDSGRCALACRALASMARSAERLCALTGDEDGRCHRAERRVAHASTRVKSACVACR